MLIGEVPILVFKLGDGENLHGLHPPVVESPELRGRQKDTINRHHSVEVQGSQATHQVHRLRLELPTSYYACHQNHNPRGQ